MPRVKAADRRNELVAAAIQVIAVHGVDGATTRKIADEANAPLATLHYCFHSKEALFAAVFEHLGEEYRRVLTDSDLPSDDLKATARTILRAVIDWYLEAPQFASATIELVSWAQRQAEHPAVTVYNAAFTAMRAALETAAHNVTPETLDEIGYVIAALSDGFAVNWLTYADQEQAGKQADLVVDVLDTWLTAKLD